MAASQPNIKAIVFDVGGVVVRSPLLAVESYENELHIPLGYINWNISRSGSDSAWQKLERNEIPMDETFFSSFGADLNNATMWDQYHKQKRIEPRVVSPNIDATRLFWNMMEVSREFNKDMVQAIEKLRETGKYRLGALTNNYVFPEGYPYRDDGEVRALFDVFIASAEVGMRKPETRIFQYTIKAMGVDHASEILFLDDLGSNLKAARELGFNTIKVPVRDSWKAVQELETFLAEQTSPSSKNKLSKL